MIRNRLAILLAERELKITRVANDTNISRNTITGIAQNDSKMMQLETINELCKYLGVTPGEFFEYAPFDFTYKFVLEDGEASGSDYEDFSWLTDTKAHIFLECHSGNDTSIIRLETSMKRNTYDDPLSEYLDYKDGVDVFLTVDFMGEGKRDEFKREYLDKMALSFQNKFHDDLRDIVLGAFATILENDGNPFTSEMINVEAKTPYKKFSLKFDVGKNKVVD